MALVDVEFCGNFVTELWTLPPQTHLSFQQGRSGTFTGNSIIFALQKLYYQKVNKDEVGHYKKSSHSVCVLVLLYLFFLLVYSYLFSRLFIAMLVEVARCGQMLVSGFLSTVSVDAALSWR